MMKATLAKVSPLLIWLPFRSMKRIVRASAMPLVKVHFPAAAVLGPISPAAEPLAVVVTVTVGLAVPVTVKSTVCTFTGSAEVTTQLALGAVVVQENVTLPEPIVPSMSMAVVLPVVAPAVTLMFPFGVSCGAGTAEGKYCRT